MPFMRGDVRHFNNGPGVEQGKKPPELGKEYRTPSRDQKAAGAKPLFAFHETDEAPDGMQSTARRPHCRRQI